MIIEVYFSPSYHNYSQFPTDFGATAHIHITLEMLEEIGLHPQTSVMYKHVQCRLLPDLWAVGWWTGTVASPQGAGRRGGDSPKTSGRSSAGWWMTAAGRRQLRRRKTRVVVHRVIQLLGLGFQQDRVQWRITHHVVEGTIEDITNIFDLVSSADTARNVLLSLSHLLRQLIFQCGNLKRQIRMHLMILYPGLDSWIEQTTNKNHTRSTLKFYDLETVLLQHSWRNRTLLWKILKATSINLFF